MSIKISDIQPIELWSQFDRICQIPRPSKKEEKMIDFLLSFAKKYQLEARQDKVGNVLIKKNATAGYEDKKSIVLQSHIDMVCEKNEDVKHNFEKDAIKPVFQDGWVKAKGTTLGADDGIGVAAQLTILASEEIEHGPLECLFTVDEESGLTGAFALESNFFESELLLNLDSEDEGELFIGCAGGIDTTAAFSYEQEEVPEGSFAMKVSVMGLQGGHSGDDIHRGLGNANKILVRYLHYIKDLYKLRIAFIGGGNLRNAIAREANAVFVVPHKYKEPARIAFNIFFHDIEMEFQDVEPNIRMKLESVDLPKSLIDSDTQNRLLGAIYACPHGVIEMSRKLPGLVETSTNLASIKMNVDSIVVSTSQRSSVESAKEYVQTMVRSVFELAGAKVTHSDGYPGWIPNPESDLLKLVQSSYTSLFEKEPAVRAIHAGLECGLFLEKYPSLDMVSFGPTIKGAHSPDERIEVESVQRFWSLLLAVLKQVPSASK